MVHKGHLHGLADFDVAAVRLLFASNHAKQRGFTRAVGADDAHDGTCRNFEAEVVDQHAVTKRLADVGELDDFMAQAFGHGNEDFLRLVALLVFEVGQLFKAGNTRLAFGLTAFGVLTYPVQLFLQGFGTGFFALLLFL